MKYLLLILLFSSCEVLKTKRTKAVDSLSVNKLDSTILKKLELLNKKDCTYTKETIYFGRDTTINNVTTPIHNYYPTQIVRESGTFSREDYLRITDSLNRAKSDSTKVNTQEESKNKKSGVSPILLGFIGLGLLLIFGVIALVILFRMTTMLKK